MSGASHDPEKLLAEALRAQATRAPADTSPVGYGLLSGSDLPGLRHSGPPNTDTTRQIVLPRPPRQVPALLILVLALLLGLAEGAVVGLLTLV